LRPWRANYRCACRHRNAGHSAGDNCGAGRYGIDDRNAGCTRASGNDDRNACRDEGNPDHPACKPDGGRHSDGEA